MDSWKLSKEYYARRPIEIQAHKHPKCIENYIAPADYDTITSLNKNKEGGTSLPPPFILTYGTVPPD